MVNVLTIRKPIGPVHPLLGRYQVLDSRSENYVHWPWEKTKHPKYKPVEWNPTIDIIDQSNLIDQGIDTTSLSLVGGTAKQKYKALGSCTGNSALYVASIVCGLEAITALGYKVGDTKECEETAIEWYSEFTWADEFLAENFLFADSGSSGYGGAKVLKKKGLIRGYEHGKNADAVCSMIQNGPLYVGMPWYNAFFEPDNDGFIDVDARWAASGLAGGHQVCWAVLESVVQDSSGLVVPDKTIIRFPNSWNRSWGVEGWGRLRLSTYNSMRRDMDVMRLYK